MLLRTRKTLDHAFSGVGVFAVGLMAAALLVILAPMFARGGGAFVFRGTADHRRVMLEQFGRGDRRTVEAESAAVAAARAPVYRMLADFERHLESLTSTERRTYRTPFKEVREAVAALLGPEPGAERRMLPRDQYGQTRWDRALVKRDLLLYREEWDHSDPKRGAVRRRVPRAGDFAGTPLADLFPYVESRLADMLRPRLTFYWQFLRDESVDSHFFGGIWPEMLGTFYLTLGAVLFAVPMGVMAAIYLAEYARPGRVVSLLRTCISTLAGVPSIVFGLFGLAFFINAMHVSENKSVLAGSLTLALMILPTVIRASEEAILAVPRTYKEAALSLGAGQWHTVMTVILPAALPGILTGIVLSMGRAAGETAPIIFTAAVSVGPSLRSLSQLLTQPTPALSWNIYNLATEHAAVDEIRHVQYGMVLALVTLVLLLNLAAIVLRARISRKLKG